MALRLGDLARAAKQKQDDAQREEFDRQITEVSEALQKLSPEVQAKLFEVALSRAFHLIRRTLR